ncbi:MAG TPA: PaaI family thioesterase [Allosphingosinicella sp.]|nr:PaaI family thioesterase [Allosphingosinicella sp.]
MSEAEREYGLATEDQFLERSGLDLLRAMIAGELPAPPISRAMGIMLVEVEKGRAVFEGRPGPHLFNPLGGIHGGFALTMIDSAAGCAVHTELHAGVGYTTVETKANFVRPVPAEGVVRCEGRVVSHGRTIATAEAYLRTEEGKLLAHGTSTLIILGSSR